MKTRFHVETKWRRAKAEVVSFISFVTADISPEKAGVGGSTPSLATIIQEELFAILKLLT